MNHPSQKIAIIGAGYAGLAAASSLAERGIAVTVFESAKQLGGRARGVMHNEMLLDNGQHILLGCYRDTLRLIELVGGDVAQDFMRLPLQLTLHGRFELKAPRLPAPLHLLVGLLTAKGLSLGDCLAAARFMIAMRLRKFKLPPFSQQWEREQELTALALLQRHAQSDKLIRLLWEPICISALNTPIHKASAQVLLNVLRDSLNGSRADSDMLLPRLDFSALFPNRAANYVTQRGGKVLTSCGVESIQPCTDGFTLHTQQGAETFSHVICAASPSNAARLLQALLPDLAAQISAIPFQPIYTVYLHYPAHITLPQAMLGLDGCVSQWLFDRGQIAGQHGLIAVVISAQGVHQNLTHEQLADQVTQELRAELGIHDTPLWHQVIAEKRATFSCDAGLLRPSHRTALKHLFLAGDYTASDYPATLEGAVMSGLRCAEAIF